MAIIAQKIATDLPKDHKNTDPHLSRDHSHDLINIEETALASGFNKDCSCDLGKDQETKSLHDLRQDQKVKAPQDLEVITSKERHQDHDSEQAPSCQTRSNVCLAHNTPHDLSIDRQDQKSRHLDSQGKQNVPHDHSCDLNSCKPKASNQVCSQKPGDDVAKDQANLGESDPCKLESGDHNNGMQSSALRSNVPATCADPNLESYDAVDEASSELLELKSHGSPQQQRKADKCSTTKTTKRGSYERDLVKANRDVSVKLDQAQRQIVAKDKLIETLSTAIDNIESTLLLFIHSVREISQTRFNGLDGCNGLGLKQGNLSRLQAVLHFISESVRDINLNRIANVHSANLSQSSSEKSKAAVPYIDEEDSDIYQDEPYIDEEDSDVYQDEPQIDTKAKLPRLKGPKSRGTAEKTFGHNCKEVAEKIEEIHSNSELAIKLLSYQKDNPLPKKKTTIFDGRKNFEVNLNDLFALASEYISPHCICQKTPVQGEVEQANEHHDLSNIKKIDEIKSSNYVLEPSEECCNGFCKKCNNLVDLKIMGKSYSKVSKGVSYGAGAHAVIVSSYTVYCPKCHEKYPMSLTDMNVSKHLVEACVPYDEYDSLHVPEHKIYDSVNSLSLSNDAKKIKQDLYDIQAEQENTFVPEDALSRLDAASKSQKYIAQQDECGKRASDIKNQPHVKTMIGSSIHSLKECLAFAMTPLFKGCAYSAGLFAEMLGAEQGYSSNSRFHKTLLCKGMDEVISRSRLNELSIIFSRAYLHGVAKQIQNQILRNHITIHCDETPINLAFGKDKEKGGCQTGYLWAISSPSVDRDQKVYIEAHNNRGHGAFLSVIDHNDESVSFKYAVTDAYSGYDKAMDIMIGQKRKHAQCYAHLRRPMHQHFSERGLNKTYSQLLYKSKDGADFFRVLKEQAMLSGDKAPGGITLGSNTVLLLMIFHVINQLFVNDAYVTDSLDGHHTSESLNKLDTVRKEHSAYLIASLNILIETYIAANNTLIQTNKGRVFKENLTSNKLTNFFRYWMNQRHKLIEFINEPMVQLSNNDIERAFRFPAILKHIKLSFKTMDGCRAFADQMTILQNCNICGVDVRLYIPWLVHKVQTAINNLTPADIASVSAEIERNWPEDYEKLKPVKNKMPRKLTYGSGVNKVSLGLYDLDNPYNALYDKISYEGLTPLDFKRERLATPK